MKAKLYVKQITKCAECPLSNWYVEDWFCEMKLKSIMDMEIISDWCPLEDAKVKEVNE